MHFMTETFLTAGEVAIKLRVTKKTVSRYEKKGLIVSKGPGRKKLYSETDITSLLSKPKKTIN